MPGYQYWLVATEAHITTLTLNRAEANNSLTPETLSELRAITTDLRASQDTWAVVVQGQGEHFSTGVDTGVIQSLPDQPEPIYRERLLNMQRALDEFEALEKPTIAKLRGFCIGGGLLLALCCDFRIASERTVFSLPEVKLGIAVLMGTQRLTRTVGVAAAKEMILLGERFNARKAATYGLVHKVVAPGELDTAVAGLAGKFRNLPPRTVGIAKRIIHEGYHLSLRDSQDLEMDVLADLLMSPDFREALASYLEKRQPVFTGE